MAKTILLSMALFLGGCLAEQSHCLGLLGSGPEGPPGPRMGTQIPPPTLLTEDQKKNPYYQPTEAHSAEEWAKIAKQEAWYGFEDRQMWVRDIKKYESQIAALKKQITDLECRLEKCEPCWGGIRGIPNAPPPHAQLPAPYPRQP